MKKDHKYLLYLYAKVDDYLTSNQTNQEELPDIVVSFCIVFEKIIKIKLYKKNPILIFESSKIRNNDALIAVITKKEKDIETTKIEEALDRFKLVFKNIFSDDELQALTDIYKIRNKFIHGYKPDNDILFNKEDVVKKIGTIWEKVSNQAIILFGKNRIKESKPKKKYSEEELEKVLLEEVKTKIKLTQRNYGTTFSVDLYGSDLYQVEGSVFGFSGEKCPRCGSFGFSLDGQNSDNFLANNIDFYPFNNFSDLYKCKKCNLELTRKEYEMAKRIKNMQGYRVDMG